MGGAGLSALANATMAIAWKPCAPGRTDLGASMVLPNIDGRPPLRIRDVRQDGGQSKLVARLAYPPPRSLSHASSSRRCRSSANVNTQTLAGDVPCKTPAHALSVALVVRTSSISRYRPPGRSAHAG